MMHQTDRGFAGDVGGNGNNEWHPWGELGGQADGGAPGGDKEQSVGIAQTGERSFPPHPGGACGVRGWRDAPRTHVRADFPGPWSPA